MHKNNQKENLTEHVSINIETPHDGIFSIHNFQEQVTSIHINVIEANEARCFIEAHQTRVNSIFMQLQHVGTLTYALRFNHFKERPKMV